MRTVRRGAAILLAGAGLLVLAGCTSNPVAAQPSGGSAPTAPASAPVSTPTTPPPTQDASLATAVKMRCKAVVPTEQVRLLVPDLRVEKGWVPEDDDPMARLESLHGTTCRWSDAAGDLLEIGVAKPDEHDAEALKNDLVERSQSVPTYGTEAYFQVVDHIGEADVFKGKVWLSVRSNRFFEPGDATGIVNAALASLFPSASPTPTDTPTAPATTAAAG